VIRRGFERSVANHPCRVPTSPGSGHRTAAQVGHALEIQPGSDLAKSRAGGRGASAEGSGDRVAFAPSSRRPFPSRWGIALADEDGVR
jgi:hypothetical protein